MSKLPTGAAKDKAKAKPVKKYAKAGRPSPHDKQKVMIDICGQLIDGLSLRTICKQAGMPSMGTVMVWLNTDKGLQEQYARAREIQAEVLAEEILEISDNARNDYMEKFDKDGASLGYFINGENVARSRLRVDSRKWYAAKLYPKKFSDRTVLEGNVEAPIQVESTNTHKLDTDFKKYARHLKAKFNIELDMFDPPILTK